MTIKDYQYIETLPTGATYEKDVLTYFKIDTNQTLEKVSKDLEDALKITPIEINDKFILKHNGKKYRIQNDFLESTYEQWSRLEIILAEENNVQNLHKLISIYLTPYSFYWYKKKYKFSLEQQEEIANEILTLDMNIAQSLILFFYQNATKSMRYINISYLNKMKQEMSITEPIRSRLMS